MKQIRAGLMFFLPLVLSFAEPAGSQVLGYSIASDQLVELDLETGAFSTIGSIGTFEISGLAMARDGFLYGVSRFTDDLWHIDPAIVGLLLVRRP